MDFSLTDAQKTLRDHIVRFARNELSPGARDRDRDHAFPHDLWQKCGEFGLQGLPLPAEYGGAGLDPLSTALAIEALGYGCEDAGLVFSVCAHMLACAVPLWLHGTEAQKRRWLPDLCSGRLIAVNAMTEPAGGSDAFNMATRATATADGFSISGTKIFASNGPVADLAVVYAATDKTKGFLGGVTAFLVPAGTPGFSKGQTFEKMGLRTCPIGELVFDDVRVGPENVLGTVGGGGPIFNQSMEWERICLVAAHVGRMEWILERTIAYARDRKSFGKPIGQYQAVSHRIADMKLRLETSRLMTRRAAWLLSRKSSPGLDAALTKLCVSEALVVTARDALQIMGGYGFMTEYDIERAVRDAQAATIYSGTSDMQRNIVAQWLGL